MSWYSAEFEAPSRSAMDVIKCRVSCTNAFLNRDFDMNRLRSSVHEKTDQRGGGRQMKQDMRSVLDYTIA